MLTLIACAKKDSGAPQSGSSVEAPPSQPRPSSGPTLDAAPTAPITSDAAASDGSDEVARRVVRDVGSKALGSQTIDAACVSVTIMPSGDWTVATARLKNCGDKTARSILWVYKRKGGPWSEDYVGQPPKCWKGVPPDIADALTLATKIPRC